ncbi:Clp protease ClpP [Clostridium botulinum D/C]|uniref:head maturation protease, ClpP-related n=1 Tax=Clostridium botulinum TaxID=1491 RepID=UPI001E6013F9|nr:head maturation protease, ClpP-related [Clostridium botulinum]MCD3351269.1 Clp protease ClpP [Clostridium botulinum D/C]MCD3360226.1 Clp protease ClpP [Clostridium botulinum D/C]MCD3361671.1 Clp protease ClpP [Clostridium botulinum D/C]MCD3366031.1 Clp protease ClpP [Clostridium botulinum D/C]
MAKVNVKGTIVDSEDKWIYDWLDLDATCPKDVEKAIDTANGEDLEILVNSGGGSVFAGSEIYTLLKDYKGNTTVKILGMAGSSASVIAMAGKKIVMSPTAQIMIHNVACRSAGDYKDMQHTAEILENANKAICNSYILKTGMKQEELLDLMNKETWMNAQKAKEYGFIDEVMFDDSNKLTNSINDTTILPSQVINKVRNLLNENKDKKLNNPQIKDNEDNKNNDDEELNNLKNKLAFKNKNIASFLLCQNERNDY